MWRQTIRWYMCHSLFPFPFETGPPRCLRSKCSLFACPWQQRLKLLLAMMVAPPQLLISVCIQGSSSSVCVVIDLVSLIGVWNSFSVVYVMCDLIFVLFRRLKSYFLQFDGKRHGICRTFEVSIIIIWSRDCKMSAETANLTRWTDVISTSCHQK